MGINLTATRLIDSIDPRLWLDVAIASFIMNFGLQSSNVYVFLLRAAEVHLKTYYTVYCSISKTTCCKFLITFDSAE